MRLIRFFRPSQCLLAGAALVAALGYASTTRADQSVPAGDVVASAGAAQAAAGACDVAGLKAAAAGYAAARGTASADQQSQADLGMSQALTAFAACGHGAAGATTDGQAVTLPLTLYAAGAAGWLNGIGCLPTAIAVPSGTSSIALPTELSPAMVAPLTDGRTAVVWAPSAAQPSLGSLLGAMTAGHSGDCRPTGDAAPVVLTAALAAPVVDLATSPLSTGSSTTTTTSSGTSTSATQVTRSIQTSGTGQTSQSSSSGQSGQPPAPPLPPQQPSTGATDTPSTGSTDTPPATSSTSPSTGSDGSGVAANPTLHLDRKLALPGTTITLSGSGFTPNSNATICWSGSASTCEDVAGTGPAGAAVDGTGAFSVSFVVPNEATGAHTIDVKDSAGLDATTTFTVMGS